MKFIFFFFMIGLMTTGCKSTAVYKDIPFTQNSAGNEVKLNIFAPKKSNDKKLPVLIFVHGGNWNSGNKNTYNLMGKNFARKNIIAVIPDYTLSPAADVDQMTKEIASAVQFIKTNIQDYSGDPQKIFISGHSAGGQLAASAVMNPKYNIPENIVSGIILIDAAGLDMKNYLEQNPPTAQNDYDATWSKDPEKWKQASPIYFITEKTPPFLMYVGNKTYPSIKVANENFLKALHPFQPGVKPVFINKKHIPMVIQYFFPWSKRLDETLEFIKKSES